MVRVKICGITNREDALYAADCGADALGFVFYAGSPRCVTPETVTAICAELPPFVSRVGLFVNETSARIAALAGQCGLDVVQLHGDEAPEACAAPPLRVIKALRLRDAESLVGHERYRVSALLLDAWVAESFGGTGQCCDWTLAEPVARLRPVILAGGLTPENVGVAIRQVRPYAVDVSSGVEMAPGRKNPRKVAQFIRLAKEAC
jgi:phosphoribosylanthranilate isomerase